MIINKYFNFIKLTANEILGSDWKGKLNKIERKAIKSRNKIREKKLRVLIGPSFAIYPPSFAMDKALSIALNLRDVDVIPIYCDSVQQEECNCIGGEWSNMKSFSKNCKMCKKSSEQLWQQSPNKPIAFSDYLSDSDIEMISATVLVMDFESALDFSENGIAYGLLAKDILVNNYLVATPTLIDNHEHLIKVHLKNLLMISLVYERILDEQKPDRVISNDSYYGMWAILEKHCKTRGIPYYSHWPITYNRVAFAYNDAAMNLNFSKSWPEFSKKALTASDEERIEKWLAGERGLVIDTTKLSGHECDDPVLSRIDPSKPTLILAANVIWDLAALNKQILFADMIEWATETMAWFREHTDFQLIIRPHPTETSPKIPRTRETIATSIEMNDIQVPENVFLLKADAKTTLKELIEKFNVRGVTVHTTTVGFECPARGLPVITTAKSHYRGRGFTFDPVTKQEYFLCLSDLLTGERKLVSESSRDLAKKFIKFYQFHYYSNIGIFVGNPPEISENIMKALNEDNGPFGYVINSIIEGLPINSCDRWLPES